MKVIVVGAGFTGVQLARSLADSGAEVVLVENDPERARVAREQVDCSVLEADGYTLGSDGIYEKGGKKLQEKAGRGLFVALMLFVGIPVPGTGAWTGTLAASILDMDFKSTILAVVCGVALAGCIIGLLCTLGLGAFLGVAA